VTQAYVGLALGRGLGAGPCLISLFDGPIGIEEPVNRPHRAFAGVKNCVKQPMAISIGAGSRLRLDDHLVRLGASEIRLQEFIAAASKTFSLCYWLLRRTGDARQNGLGSRGREWRWTSKTRSLSLAAETAG
jgi:hypothetical protein